MTNENELEINEIYDILADLRHGNSYSNISPDTVKVAYDFYFLRLRTLQQKEADEIERRLNDSLELQIGAGHRLLDEAEELKKKYSKR